MHANYIYHYTKEKIVCTVKYAGNCQSVKSNKNVKNIGKTLEKQKKDLLFGVGYGTLFERMEEGLFFMPKKGSLASCQVTRQ